MPARRPTSPMPTSTTSRSPASGPSRASSRTSPTSSTRSRTSFAPNTVETTYLYNDKTKKKAYYAFPLKQQTMHIQYWIDMLERGRLQGIRHPEDLEGLLGVLVRQGAAGATARRPASAPIGIGQPMGVDSSDSFYSFLTFMDAYNVKLVDDNGKLLVDDPKVKQGLIGALTRLHRRRTPRAARRRRRRAGRTRTTTSPSTTRRR